MTSPVQPELILHPRERASRVMPHGSRDHAVQVERVRHSLRVPAQLAVSGQPDRCDGAGLGAAGGDVGVERASFHGGRIANNQQQSMNMRGLVSHG